MNKSSACCNACAGSKDQCAARIWMKQQGYVRVTILGVRCAAATHLEMIVHAQRAIPRGILDHSNRRHRSLGVTEESANFREIDNLETKREKYQQCQSHPGYTYCS